MLALAPQDLESLRSFLADRLVVDSSRSAGEACDRSLRYTTNWLSMRGLDVDAYTAWLNHAKIDCDCAVLIYIVLI